MIVNQDFESKMNLIETYFATEDLKLTKSIEEIRRKCGDKHCVVSLLIDCSGENSYGLIYGMCGP